MITLLHQMFAVCWVCKAHIWTRRIGDDLDEAIAAHYVADHPGVVPFACRVCRRGYPRVNDKPCSDVSPLIVCAAYDPDPEAF